METTQLIASGLSHCITELSNRSDMHVVEVCRACRTISDICSCPSDVVGTDKVALPLDAIKYMYASRIALKLDTKIIYMPSLCLPF